MAEKVGVLRVSRLVGLRPTDPIWIEQADPLIWISVELLEDAANHSTHESVSYGDGIFTIRGENRTVSYGIGEYLFAQHAYVARKSPEPVVDGDADG